MIFAALQVRLPILHCRWTGRFLQQQNPSASAYRARATSTLGLLVISLALSTTSARAALEVYASPRRDGVGSTSTPLPIYGDRLVHVYMDNGSSGAFDLSKLCTPAGGDEICQWAVRLETTGGLRIADVAWNGVAVEDDEPTSPATMRNGTGGDAEVGQRGPTRIATVSLAGTDGALLLKTPGPMGFVDKDGTVLTVDPGGVVLARSAKIGWRQISVNEDHSCGVLTDRTLRCWGADFTGSPSPPGGSFDSVAVSADGACAIDLAGGIHCWGSHPTPPAGAFERLAAGQTHMCGLRDDLTIECFGGSIPNPDPDGNPLTIEGYSSVSRGFDHACAILLDGAVVCWGSDDAGEASPPSGGFIRLAGGDLHTCGITFDGRIECWGLASMATHKPTSGVFESISASATTTCALEAGGDIECWNASSSWTRIGPFTSLSVADTFQCAIRPDGAASCFGTGVAGSDLPPVVAFPKVAIGDRHGCRLDGGGALTCWMGDPLLADASGVDAPPGGDFNDLSSGDLNGCAVATATGLVTCWGDNANLKNDAPPAQPFVSVETGELHSCGLRPDATLECWGTGAMAGLPAGSHHQLSMASGADYGCAVDVDDEIDCWGTGAPSPPPGPFIEVAAGRLHACGLHANGSLECFGDDSLGQLGAPPGTYEALAAGDDHTCARSSGGSILCWGDDTYGQSSPPGLEFVALSAGSDSGASASTCGVTSSGGMVCWGSNDDRQSEPPLDSDLDGYEDGIDNCPGAPNAPLAGTCVETLTACANDGECTGGADYCSLGQEDSDGDGWGDACDNCATRGLTLASQNLPNADQFDRDADGWGDACDNCAGVFQLNQADADADGIGDLCEAATLRIVETQPPPQPAMDPSFAGEAAALASSIEYDLLLSCPFDPVKQIELAVVIPAEIDINTVTSAVFGPDCASEPVPLGFDCGSAPAGQEGCCLSSLMLTENVVDLEKSYAVMGKDFGGRSDSVYFRLEGVGGQLCAPLAEDVLLARVVLPTAPTGGGVASLTNDQILEVASDPALQFPQAQMIGEAMLDIYDEPLAYADWATISGPPGAAVQIDVSPNLGDESGFEWMIRLTAEMEISNLVVGFRAPVGATEPGEIVVQGCTSSNCAGGGVGPYVNTLLSISEGPGITVPSGVPDDVIFLELVGAEASEFPGVTNATLNHVGETIPIAVVKVIGLLATPHVAPVVTFEAADLISAPDPPILPADPGITAPDPVEDVQATGSGQQSEDVDGDAIASSDDNCPFTPNADQSDNGGFKSTIRNQIGDACECGEVSGDGQIFGAGGSTNDVLEMQKVLAGLSVQVGADERCSVSGDTQCDLLDVFLLARAIDEDDIGLLRRTCASAVPDEAASGG